MKEYVQFHQIIRYEDILKEPANFINQLAEKYSFPKPAIFKNITNLLTNSHGIKNQQFHKDYYLDEDWKKSLRHEHVQLINTWLNESLMNELNYSII